jgi:hypothetical protein
MRRRNHDSSGDDGLAAARGMAIGVFLGAIAWLFAAVAFAIVRCCL